MTEPVEPVAGAGEVPCANVDDPAPGSPDYILAVLKNLEEGIHLEEGWDNDPMLFALVGHGEEANGWDLEALVVDPILWHMPGTKTPTEALAFHMKFLAGWDARPGVPTFPFGDFVERPLRAAVLVAETWSLLAAKGVREQGPDRLKDHAGAIATRMVNAVLPDGTVAFVQRVRGRTPEHDGYRFNPATGDQAIFGPMVKGIGNRIVNVDGVMVNLMRAFVNAVNAAAGMPQIAYHFKNDAERRFLEVAKGGPW